MLSLIVVAVPLLCVISFLLSPLIAIRRGYAPYYWMFACGPIGLVVITLLPPLKAARDPEEYERFQDRANFLGAVLSWIGIFVAMIPVVALLSFVLLTR